MTAQQLNSFRTGPDERGHFGIYGGRFVAETLMPLVLELEKAYAAAKADPAFKQEMDAAKADCKFVNYPGAVHAFTNPDATEKGQKFNLPLRYDAKPNKEAEAEASKFFAAVFKK